MHTPERLTTGSIASNDYRSALASERASTLALTPTGAPLEALRQTAPCLERPAGAHVCVNRGASGVKKSLSSRRSLSAFQGRRVRSALYAAANIVMTRLTKPSTLKAWGSQLAIRSTRLTHSPPFLTRPPLNRRRRQAFGLIRPTISTFSPERKKKRVGNLEKSLCAALKIGRPPKRAPS